MPTDDDLGGEIIHVHDDKGYDVYRAAYVGPATHIGRVNYDRPHDGGFDNDHRHPAGDLDHDPLDELRTAVVDYLRALDAVNAPSRNALTIAYRTVDLNHATDRLRSVVAGDRL